MTYKIKTDKFQGPLDVLLQLIENEELDITEISLSKVTKQYISHLEKVEELFPEDLADFLVIATKLLLLKSRTLLPYLKIEDEEEETDLEEQLKIYKEYADASKLIEELLKKGQFAYNRSHIKFAADEVIFSPPKKKLTSKMMNQIFQEALKALEPVVRLPKAAIEKAVTIREKICMIEIFLEKELKTSFGEITKNSENKKDVIITFLAILELVKKQNVCVQQDEHFGDFSIKKMKQEN